MSRFEVVESLAAFADTAIRFSATGQGQHREGLVVRFCCLDGKMWVGNFQPGLGGTSIVVEHPDGRQVIVLAMGQGYLVDPDEAVVMQCFGAQVVDVISVADLNMIIFGNGLGFDALGPSGWLWRTRRMSWDGMRNLRLEVPILTGEAWHYTDQWRPFTLHLATGKVIGGSYDGPSDV